ncbi:glycosyltransferase family 4 protein [Candidatus Roizmanbacteria bacterium]|nr:glycosyltransferase family 4 protein [Candidatus Roizmanbacteria bacterium]
MKKILKVGLYNPFLDTLGGGEKHILSIVDVLAEAGHEVKIFWNKNLTKKISQRFSLHYINKMEWLPLALKTLQTFDYFFYVTDGSYFFSSSKKNFVFCMVPDKKLYNLNFFNRLKLWNYRFISNSPYTTKWLTKWGIDPVTIPPYVDGELFSNAKDEKEKIILSVGRFFPHLHSKNQQKIIIAFKRLKQSSPLFKDYIMIIAGGLKNEDKKYFDKLKSFSKDPSIIFKPNVSLDELYKLYKSSSYFWHFAGLGVDENKHPEQVEHFGIAPLEAIVSGCLTFCHDSGGPKEIINDGKTGFLFKNEGELIKQMISVETNKILRNSVRKQGRLMVKKGYNYQVFKKNVLKII